jgi:hypothetical protein
MWKETYEWNQERLKPVETCLAARIWEENIKREQFSSKE